jgi:hypothetical protein
LNAGKIAAYNEPPWQIVQVRESVDRMSGVVSLAGEFPQSTEAEWRSAAARARKT